MIEQDNRTEILELPEADLAESFKVMRELRTHLSQEQYLERLTEMRSRGYRLLALKVEGEIVALAGVTFDLNLYWGRRLFVYDLVTAEAHRSKGYGEKLLSYIHDLARAENCEAVALSSGFAREGAHRFYEREGYERTGYVFHKRLEDV